MLQNQQAKQSKMYHVFGELCAHVSNRVGNTLLALVQVRCLAGLGAGVGCLKVEHHLAERFGLKTVRNVALGRPHRLGRLDSRCLKVLHVLDGKGENGFTMNRKSFVLFDADGLLSFEAFA